MLSTLALFPVAAPLTLNVSEPIPVVTVNEVPVAPTVNVAVPSYTLLALKLTVAGVTTY